MSQIRRKPRPQQIGVSPTTSQKLVYVSDKLKLTGIKDMQGSTVNIFDTVILSTNATARQTLSFFSQSNGKSRNFSNFQNGTLTAGDTLVCETVTFFLVGLSTNSLTADTTTITSMVPLSQVTADQVSLPKALTLGLMNISIANSKVVKDYFTYEQNPPFNPKTNGISLGGALQASDDLFAPIPYPIGQSSITLESPPVLPPNQKIELTYEIPPVGTVSGTSGIMCVLGRFGSIYAAKTTL